MTFFHFCYYFLVKYLANYILFCSCSHLFQFISLISFLAISSLPVWSLFRWPSHTSMNTGKTGIIPHHGDYVNEHSENSLKRLVNSLSFCHRSFLFSTNLCFLSIFYLSNLKTQLLTFHKHLIHQKKSQVRRNRGYRKFWG